MQFLAATPSASDCVPTTSTLSTLTARAAHVSLRAPSEAPLHGSLGLSWVHTCDAHILEPFSPFQPFLSRCPFLGRVTMPRRATSTPSAGAASVSSADHGTMQVAMRTVKACGMTEESFASRFNMSYDRARYYIHTGGAAKRRGPAPFFSAAEEALLAECIITNATIGRGLSQEAVCRVCAECLADLSAERQAAAVKLFGGTLEPGRSWVNLFLSRHPELRKYRFGTLEEGRARNGRPDVVASWFSILTLLYRDYRVNSPWQVWNMDETLVQARKSATSGREGILEGVGMVKPEVIMPDFASGAGACTAAFCVSAAGVVAPHFIVFDGQTPGPAYLLETRADGSRKEQALSSYLNDGAVVWRHSPPGLDKAVFDVWASTFAKFARSYFPDEDNILSLDGAKVHLSTTGLLTLLKARVHVVAEPSKMSHILQALDNPSAFGRYQPRVRRRVREIALECWEAGRPFNTPELMWCIARAASEALTVDALTTAFRRVGMWPLDPTVVRAAELFKGADALVQVVDLAKLKQRLIPRVRKDMSRPVDVEGTLSTAGRGTSLTAPEIMAALDETAATKVAAKALKHANKRARDQHAADNKIKDAAAAKTTRAKLEAKEDEMRREASVDIGSEASHEAGCRLRMMGWALPMAAKTRRRLAAARLHVPPVSPRVLWRVVAREAARVGGQRQM